MSITEAQYIKHKQLGHIMAVKATINGQVNYVPLNPNNTDYAEILRLVETGQLTIKEAD